MLYALAHILRDKMPWIWDCIESINSWLFYFRYKRKLGNIDSILQQHQGQYSVKRITAEDIQPLLSFFGDQPEDAFKYFKPHAFDAVTLGKIQRSKSFLAFIVKEGDNIVGYFFLRCYFMGKAFRGYMTDYRYRNQGISRLTAKVMTDITDTLGIPSFGTIAPDNIASMRSQNATIIRQLANGDYYVKY